MVVVTMVEMLVEVACVGIVFESSGGGFVVVVLEDFGVVLWCGWRMALWCSNERGEVGEVSMGVSPFCFHGSSLAVQFLP